MSLQNLVYISHTVVPQYSLLIHSGTRMSAEPEEYQTVKYFLLWGGVVTPRSPEQALSAEASSEVNEYRGMTIYVYQYISLLVKSHIFL